MGTPMAAARVPSRGPPPQACPASLVAGSPARPVAYFALSCAQVSRLGSSLVPTPELAASRCSPRGPTRGCHPRHISPRSHHRPSSNPPYTVVVTAMLVMPRLQQGGTGGIRDMRGHGYRGYRGYKGAEGTGHRGCPASRRPLPIEPLTVPPCPSRSITPFKRKPSVCKSLRCCRCYATHMQPTCWSTQRCYVIHMA